MSKYLVRVEVDVEVEVNNDDAIARCVENLDVDGNPQPDNPQDRNNRGWRNVYYDLDDKDKVLEHLAFNCIANGVETASRLDGWADLPRDAVTMRLDRQSFDPIMVQEV